MGEPNIFGVVTPDATPAVSADGFSTRLPPEQQKTADMLFDGGDEPRSIRVLPGELYGPAILTAKLDDCLPKMFVETGMSEATQEKIRTMALDLAERVKLPEGDVVRILDAALDAHVALHTHQADPDAARAALNEQIATWNVETRTALKDAYGKDAPEMLARLQKFTREEHPALGRVLAENGLGSRPDIVLGLAAHVFSTGYR